MIYMGEAQLARWSETSSGGATITLWLPDGESLAPFKRLTERKGKQAGQILAIAVNEVDEGEQQPIVADENGGYGHWYTPLHPGWFLSDAVMAAFGATDKTTAQADIKAEIYRAFSVSSMSQIPPHEFAKFVSTKGVYWTLPALLRLGEGV